MDEGTAPVADRHGLEILSPDECWALVGETPIGRLAFVHEGEPVVLPVSYGLRKHQVVFRSAQGAKLGAAKMQRPVAFEVDQWDVETRSGWSVLIEGLADTVDDADEVAEFESLGVLRWTPRPFVSEWVRIVATDISGRRTSGLP